MPKPVLPSGLIALTGIAAYFRIAADPTYLKRELALDDDECRPDDILRAAKIVGLKARKIQKISAKRLSSLPTPCILKLKTGSYVVYGGESGNSYTTPATNVKFMSNRFRCGDWLYGAVAAFNPNSTGNVWTGNFCDQNGTTVRP